MKFSKVIFALFLSLAVVGVSPAQVFAAGTGNDEARISASVHSPAETTSVETVNGCTKLSLQEEISEMVSVPEVTKQYGLTDDVRISFTASEDGTLDVVNVMGNEPAIMNHVERSLDGQTLSHSCYVPGVTYSWTIKVRNL